MLANAKQNIELFVHVKGAYFNFTISEKSIIFVPEKCKAPIILKRKILALFPKIGRACPLSVRHRDIALVVT